MDSSPEAHRAFVREINENLASWYGFGGGAVLAGGALVLGVAWMQGILNQLATWMVCVTILLIETYVLRVLINRKKRTLVARVNAYCETNKVDAKVMLDHFRATDAFPFYSDLFPSS